MENHYGEQIRAKKLGATLRTVTVRRVFCFCGSGDVECRTHKTIVPLVLELPPGGNYKRKEAGEKESAHLESVAVSILRGTCSGINNTCKKD